MPLVVFFFLSCLAFQKRPRRFVVVIVVSFSSTVVREMVFLLFQKKERSFLSPETMLKRGDSEWIIDFPVRFSSRQLAFEFSFVPSVFLFSDNACLCLAFLFKCTCTIEHNVSTRRDVNSSDFY